MKDILKVRCSKRVEPLPNKIARSLPSEKMKFGRPARLVKPKPIC
jgi:hypothetical protein